MLREIQTRTAPEPPDAKIALLQEESEKVFNAELSRMDALTEKAEKYLTVTGALVGIYLVDVVAMEGLVYGTLVVGALALFAAALTSMLLALRVRQYRAFPPGAEILEKLRLPEVTANAARIMFATMYCEARDVNAGINNQRARLLARAGAFLTAGFVLAAASHLLAKL